MELIDALIIGALGSVLGAGVLWLLSRSQRTTQILGRSFQLARRITDESLTRFHFSRDDYGRSLRSYLAQADESIVIVSVSLKATHDEGDFIELFERCLARNPDFRVTVSLMNPASAAADLAADSLSMPADRLKREISEMLETLLDLKDRLSPGSARRLRVLVHSSFPMGSVIMLDASPRSGTIQVETKLYRSPRTESFGFEIGGPSPFFNRNYQAWLRVIDESDEWTGH